MRYRSFVFVLFCFVNVFAGAKVIEKTIAVVDDEMIFLSEMRAYKKLLSSSLAPSGSLFQLNSKKNLRKSRKKLINFMIDERVLKSQLPEEQAGSPSGEELLRKKLKKQNISKKYLKKKLLKIGFSLKQYQDILYYNHLFEKWIQTELASTIQILNTDINNYYRIKTGKNFFKQYKYDLNQWRFELSKAGRAVAEKFSKQMEKKKKPSKTLSLTEEQMNSDLRKTISKMSVGQFSKPVCFGSHCYVFELLQKSFLVSNQARTEKLRSKIFQEKFLSKLKDWLKDKRKNSFIKKYR